MTMVRTVASYPAAIALYFVCIGLLYPISALEDPRIIDVTAQGVLGSNANITCLVIPENTTIEWLFNSVPLKPSDSNGRINITNKIAELPPDSIYIDQDGNKKSVTSRIDIKNVSLSDVGNYTCSTKPGGIQVHRYLNLSFEARLLNQTKGPIETAESDNATISMKCIFEAYNVSEVKWYKLGDELPTTKIPNQLDARRIESVQHYRISNFSNNGTYVCEIDDNVSSTTKRGYIDVKVFAPPKVVIENVIAINTTELYLNWSVYTYNSEVKSYTLMYRKILPTNNETQFELYMTDKIGPKNTSFVMRGLEKSTKYQLKLEVTTYNLSKPDIYKEIVETLAEEPIFIPNISINGFSATSVTISWAPPSPKIENLIHYYILEARKKGENVPRRAYHSRDGRNLPYMFDNLEPHSTYVFQVCACSDFTKRCGSWSEEMEAATLDGIPSKPRDVLMVCDSHYANLTWGPPDQPNAEIKGYSMELTGSATFKDKNGNDKVVTWGPLSKFTTNKIKIQRFDELQPNTAYTVHVTAMTRTRRRGEEQVAHCTTKPALPDNPPRPRWRKIVQNETYMFKMHLPRISERNGPLCCYRVYMVRLLPNFDWMKLPSPKEMPMLEYKDAHAPEPALGAYLTDVFSNENFPSESELVMGDGKSFYNPKEERLNHPNCSRCLKRVNGINLVPVTTSSTTTSPTTTMMDDLLDDDGFTADPVEVMDETRTRRSHDENYSNNPTMSDKTSDNKIKVFDGPLDTTANYTLFVEVIAEIEGQPSLYSDYLNLLMPAPTPTIPQPASVVEIALQVTCAVAALILLLMIVFCIRQTRKSRKLPPHAHLEMDSVPLAFRWMPCLPRRAGAAPAPPDMAPIPRDQLAKAYAERQADSDYGFQKEFEMLPECFTDRTTHASDARENQPKNRYPDIKAYDQTRVKLTQIDSINGSDYINANYVMGYQDRKQFICAQGPTDTTVNDFWRMIWEQGLELIVMLTNLEEYSKVKCSKYWPDEVRGSRAFGAITVHHVGEKRYSDYIVRELRITKQPTNADGQPIVENNGVAKRNGDCKEPNDNSVPTSPREQKDTEGRIVKQYHFLMWKDFAAPEHAYSILKFIKRVNAAWSRSVSACCVHCSAGVGRTGTLVALDCLLEQLNAHGHVAVFNTIAELRTQRNFLVQSLKQYVFVYRALVEYAHFGDTEIPASKLKAAVDRLRSTPPQATACLMEIEFQKILNSPIPEPVKSCAAGAAEELRAKNRSQEVLPYDRNRVILAPIPGRDFSTYINASFIEAYDNSEGFIITQDPLPNTIADFWRMVSEHNVTTIVMLSELGEGKCPRYWEDGTAQFEHVSVQYEDSESCPYYTRRHFRVINNKSGWSSGVVQLQYQGWPTAAGHVPEVTRGLAELADAAAPGAMLVHCHLGTERSALFVSLCVLVGQLRAERRVDVCCVARKVRHQRRATLDTFLQYEFLHRAILNYAELHNLLEDS